MDLPVVPGADRLEEVSEDADDKPGRLAFWVAIGLAVMAAIWLAGFLLMRAADHDTETWNVVWGLSGISFLFAFVPLPGVTSTLLAALAKRSWLTGLVGVGGAAIGGTAAAGLVGSPGTELEFAL